MRKAILTETTIRMKKFIINMNNLNACAKQTGIAPATIKKIIERGWATVEDIRLLNEFCDEVAGQPKTAKP